MRILVTGGTGFIGSRLSLQLLSKGHSVRVLSQINTPAEAANARVLCDRGAELVESSITDRTRYADALDGVDIVHHIAAMMREANHADSAFWDTNYRATQDLAAASQRAGVHRFVYCSTMGVTGSVKGRVVDERAPYGPNPSDIYQCTKAAAEQWLLEQPLNGLDVTVVRPVDVYGPGDQRLVKLFRMIQKGTFFFLGDGLGHRHMIFVDDLVDGMIAAQDAAAAAGEVFYLAGERSISLRELVQLIADELHVRPPRLRLPYAPVRALAGVVERVCRPLGLQPPIYPRRVDFYAHDYRFDISKSRRLLGFNPQVDVQEGVRKTAAAYRSMGLLA